MGMTAGYFMVDEYTLGRLLDLAASSPDDLAEAVFDLEERGADACDIDMLWDGLHFLFTGVSAAAPIAGNALSEAVVGRELFVPGEEADFIAYTPYQNLPSIIEALESLDWDALRAAFNPEAMFWGDIYPKIWAEDPHILFRELRNAAESLRDFYKEAQKAGRSVVLSIL